MKFVVKILSLLIFCIGMESRGESHLVEIKRDDLWQENAIEKEKALSMLEEGLKTLTGKTNVAQALSTWIQPKDVVGIKISTLGGKVLSSKPVLVNGLIEGLKATGVPGKNIIVWDKDAQSMEQAGYHLGQRRDGVRFEAVLPATGFDAKVFVTQPEVGELIWGDLEFRGEKEISATKKSVKFTSKKNLKQSLDFEVTREVARQESVRSYLAWLVTQRMTKMIHVPVLANSETVGLQGCFADLVLGSIDNSRRFQEEPLAGDPALAEIYATTDLKKKTVLHIMDGFWLQFAGGPGYAPRYCRKGSLLLFSTNPVAMDSYAAEILDAWRMAGRLPSLKSQINYLKTGSDLGLGQMYNKGQVKITKIVMSPAEIAP